MIKNHYPRFVQPAPVLVTRCIKACKGGRANYTLGKWVSVFFKLIIMENLGVHYLSKTETVHTANMK